MIYEDDQRLVNEMMLRNARAEEKSDREKCEDLARRHGGRVIYDRDQHQNVVHVHSFCYITADGTKVHEWP